MTNNWRILVPIDFSEGSELALAYAGGFARRTASELTLFHVVDAPTYMFSECEFGASNLGPIQQRLASTAGERLENLLRPLQVEGAGVGRVRIRIGDAPTEILKEAIEGQYDMLIQATHGRTGFSRILFGSVAEKVMRACPISVISLKAVAGEPPGEAWFNVDASPEHTLDMSRILFPTDLSDVSLKALDTAARLASSVEAELDIVHVISDISTSPPIMWDQLPGVSPDEFYEHAERRARIRLQNVVEERMPDANWLNYRVLRGTAPDELAKFARTTPCEMIVMATHGRSGLERAVLGSVAEKIVRSAPCPVMTVRSAAH